MRFTLGLVVGAGIGYLVATRASGDRIEQIEHVIDRIRSTEAFDVASEKARAALDLGVERARYGLVGSARSSTRVPAYVPGDPSLN